MAQNLLCRKAPDLTAAGALATESAVRSRLAGQAGDPSAEVPFVLPGEPVNGMASACAPKDMPRFSRRDASPA
jgi:hypothetical protein